jgi:hypothetical protein
MDAFSSSVWSGVLAGVITAVITGVPSAVIGFMVNRKLEQRYGAGTGGTGTPPPSPPQSVGDFQQIEYSIEQHISYGSSNKPAKQGVTPEVAVVLTIVLALVAAITAQYPVLVIGALSGLSAGIALALIVTLARNRKFRRFLGWNGARGLISGLIGVLGPIAAIVALVSVRYKRLSFWDLGEEIRRNSGVGEGFANPLDWAIQSLSRLISGVIQLLQTHGLEFLPLLLFPLAAILAAIMAGVFAATTLIGWNFYIGFIVGSNAPFARRAVRAFDELTFGRVVSTVFMLILLLAVAFWGGAWIDLANGLPVQIPTSSTSPTP